MDGTTLPIDNFTGAVQHGDGLAARQHAKHIQERPAPGSIGGSSAATAVAGEAAKQWQEIRNQEFPSDVLVLLKRGGQSLDYVEGMIANVTAEKVDFKLEDDVRSIDRGRSCRANLLSFWPAL